MLKLDTVDIPTYKIVMEKLKAQNPDIQGKDTPYVVLRVIGEKQLLILQGIFRKQKYELQITELQAPNTDRKTLEEIPRAVFIFEKARVEQELKNITAP